MIAPAVPSLLVSHWLVSWPLTALLVMCAAIYLTAARRARRWPARRAVAFLLGLLVVEIALNSGLERFDDRLLTAHMLQHLLLIEAGPALLLYARPVHLTLRTLHGEERRRLGRVFVRLRRAATPVRCVSLYAVLILAWHIPACFDAAVSHQALHEAEHLSYLLAGLLVWWPLLGDPWPRHPGPIAQLLYVTVAMAPMTLIGAYLNRDQTLFYPAYAAPTHALGLAPLVNQQQAGAIMWVGGTTVMSVVGLASALNTMLVAERRQRARESHEVAR